jgi:monoterpene epsilon-lactone hydrolase
MSLQAKLLNTAIKTASFLNRRASFNSHHIDKYRRSFEKFTRYYKTPANIQRQDFSIGQLSAAWFTPLSLNNKAVILYLHGGGYMMGSINTHQALMSNIASLSGYRVLGIHYRLAPEHPFPAALDDALKAYQFLRATGYLPSQIILAGDSAGGGLALSVLLALKERGQPLPAAAICFCPWTDLSLQGKSLIFNAKKGPFFYKDAIPKTAQLYLAGTSAVNPLASPIYGDLSQLPPLFIQASDSEMLLSDSVDFAQKARAAGVEVSLDLWKDMMHAWQLLQGWLPESRQALEKMLMFINNLKF